MSRLTVTELANEWDVSEAEVFRRAHDYYYGQTISDKVLDTHYGAWITNQINLPYYVSYFIENWVFEA